MNTVSIRGQKLVALALRLGAALALIKALRSAPGLWWSVQSAALQLRSPDVAASAWQNLGWQALSVTALVAVFFGAEKLAVWVCPDDLTVELTGDLDRVFGFMLQVVGLMLLFDGLAGLGYGFKDLRSFLAEPNAQTFGFFLPRAWFTLVYVATGLAFLRFPARIVRYLRSYET